MNQVRLWLTYVSECSLEDEEKKVDWCEVQNWEDIRQLSNHAKSKHKSFPDKEKVPKDQNEMEDSLRSCHKDDQGILISGIEWLIRIFITTHRLA
jgi:hypothetical protein